ncbi:MAG: hypothetical protein ACYC26_04415 [Phycisphaerales bacterium]
MSDHEANDQTPRFYVWVAYDESVGGPSFGGETFNFPPNRVWRAIAVVESEIVAERLCEALLLPKRGDFEINYNPAVQFTDAQRLGMEHQIAELLKVNDPRIGRFIDDDPEWPLMDLVHSAAHMIEAIHRETQGSATGTEPPSPRMDSEAPKLTDTQRLIIEKVRELGEASGSSVKKRAIADAMGYADESSLNNSLAELVRSGHLTSHSGKTGGYRIKNDY